MIAQAELKTGYYWAHEAGRSNPPHEWEPVRVFWSENNNEWRLFVIGDERSESIVHWTLECEATPPCAS